MCGVTIIAMTAGFIDEDFMEILQEIGCHYILAMLSSSQLTWEPG